MPPGSTSRPLASISLVPAGRLRPMAAMTPSLMPMSASNSSTAGPDPACADHAIECGLWHLTYLLLAGPRLCAGRRAARPARMAANRGGCQHGFAPPPPHSGGEPQLQRGRDQGPRRCAGAHRLRGRAGNRLPSRSKEGPYGIETQEHVESVTLPLRRLVAGATRSMPSSSPATPIPASHVCRGGHVAAGVRHQRGRRADRAGAGRALRRHRHRPALDPPARALHAPDGAARAASPASARST